MYVYGYVYIICTLKPDLHTLPTDSTLEHENETTFFSHLPTVTKFESRYLGYHRRPTTTTTTTTTTPRQRVSVFDASLCRLFIQRCICCGETATAAAVLLVAFCISPKIVVQAVVNIHVHVHVQVNIHQPVQLDNSTTACARHRRLDLLCSPF